MIFSSFLFGIFFVFVSTENLRDKKLKLMIKMEFFPFTQCSDYFLSFVVVGFAAILIQVVPISLSYNLLALFLAYVNTCAAHSLLYCWLLSPRIRHLFLHFYLYHLNIVSCSYSHHFNGWFQKWNWTTTTTVTDEQNEKIEELWPEICFLLIEFIAFPCEC